MRASYGLQVSVALLGIGLYIFSIGYVGINSVPCFTARSEYQFAHEMRQKIPNEWTDQKAHLSEGSFKAAKVNLIRTAIIASVTFLCGICCTVAARKIQARREDGPLVDGHSGDQSQ